MLRLLAGSSVQGFTSAFSLSRAWAQLLELAGSGDVSAVAALLRRGPPRFQALGSLETIWHAAARKGSSAATLACLWQAGHHCAGLRGVLDALNHRGESPLMAALKRGHGETAMWLLSRGAQPHRWDTFRRCSTVHLAARGGSAVACAAILDRLPATQRSLWANASSGDCHVRPLHYAAGFGHAEVVRVLLRYGANLTAVCHRCSPTYSGMDHHERLETLMIGTTSTALHLAAANGHEAAAAELLDHFRAHVGTVGDPRTLTNSPATEFREWHQTPHQLVRRGTSRLALLTQPGGDLEALLANHQRGHVVPTLQTLAAAVLRQVVVASIDAVEGVRYRRSSAPQLGGDLHFGGAGGDGLDGGQGAELMCGRASLPPRRGVSAASYVAATDDILSAESSSGGGGAGSNGGARCLIGSVSARGSRQLGRLDSAVSFLLGAPPTVPSSAAKQDGGAAATAPAAAPPTSLQTSPRVVTSADVGVPSYAKGGGALGGGAGAASLVVTVESGSAEEEDGCGREGEEEELRCSVCLCNEVELQVRGCRHRLCCECMRAMAARAVDRPLLCPLCRGPVAAVDALEE